MKKLIYLAIPYSWNPEKSFKIANEVAADLISNGNVVFSPISHSHPIADHMDEDLRTDHEVWMNQDLPILERCDEVVIVSIEKHGGIGLINDSIGCTRELKLARKKKLPINIRYYDKR
jgi:nucleoside 2-deoxyribosyltransferase